MEATTGGDDVHEGNPAIEGEALAARCAATTILITADCAAAVIHVVANGDEVVGAPAGGVA